MACCSHFATTSSVRLPATTSVYLPPANEVCDRLCFYRCLSVHRGGAICVHYIIRQNGNSREFYSGNKPMVLISGGAVRGFKFRGGVHGFIRGGIRR